MELISRWKFLIKSQLLTQEQEMFLKQSLNQKLAKKLRKLIIRTSKNRKENSSSKDNIWCENLAEMQLISKYNKVIRFLR